MASNPGKTDLLFWVSMDDSGDFGADEHTAGPYDFTSNNTPTTATAKVGANAVQLTGANSESLSRTDEAALRLNDGSWTIAAWVYADSLDGTANIIMGKDDGTNREFLLLYNGSGSTFRIVVGEGSAGTDEVQLDGTTTPSTGTWYRVVAFYDAVEDVVGIAVNGVVEAREKPSFAVGSDTHDFEIGIRGGSSFPWDGRLDEVCAYTRVWSQQEIEWDYNSGSGRGYSDLDASAADPTETSPGTTDLRWWYDLDESSGDAVEDHTGGGTYDLTDVNTVGSGTGPDGGTIRDFEASNSERFSFAEDDLFNDMGDADFYTCGWAKWESLPSTHQLWAAWETTGNDRVFTLLYFSGGLSFSVSSNGSGSTNNQWSVAPKAGVWYFVEAKHDAAGNVIGLCLTPAHLTSVNSWKEAAHSGGVYAPTGTDRAPFEVGGDAINGRYFDGLMGRLAFFDAIPTDAEREWLFNSGSGRAYSDLSAGGAAAFPFHRYYAGVI